MSEPWAIRIRNLWKRYQVYRKPIDRLKEVLLFNRKILHREFTALSEINLEVEQGRTVGIIGPNGAGKSTLLKILAGLIPPTEGTYELRGRVGAIIELGTGFHPEFSGRDNFYLNASLLGFARQQIDALFERVLQFSELGSFIDMPLKTYSSGMIVRLAFSIAISLEPEILLVDEALAVGDAVFAHRCLQKISQLQEQGTTILLVTHDVNAIVNFCLEAVYLDKGRIIAQGNPREVVQLYQTRVAERLSRSQASMGKMVSFYEIGAPETSATISERRFGTFEITIEAIEIVDEAGEQKSKFQSGEQTRCRLEIHFHGPARNPIFGIMIKNRFGTEVFGTNTFLRGEQTGEFKAGDAARVEFSLPLTICPGLYSLSFAVHTLGGHFYDYRNEAALVEVLPPVPAIGITPLPLSLRIERREGEARDKVPKPLQQIYSDAPSTLQMIPEHSKFLLGEWYWLEGEAEQFRWTGPECAVILRVPEHASQLRIEGHSSLPSSIGEEQVVRLSADGELLGEQELRSGEKRSLDYRLPAQLQGRVIRFDFQVTPSFSPARAGVSNDQRELGIAIYAIDVAP